MLDLLQQELAVQQDILSVLRHLETWLYGDHGLVLVGALLVLVFVGLYIVARSTWGA